MTCKYIAIDNRERTPCIRAEAKTLKELEDIIVANNYIGEVKVYKYASTLETSLNFEWKD